MSDTVQSFPAVMITIAAIAAHEANRALCAASGDHSHKKWAEAPIWQQDSARKGVEVLLENPNITPEQLHERWKEVKVADGWVYGAAKDAEKKTHPCLVPYEELPALDKRKDYTFRDVVKGICAEFGVEMGS